MKSEFDNLKISEFAPLEQDGDTFRISNGPLPLRMADSDATAKSLISDTQSGMGADMIRFLPGDCVQEHVHPGDHVLVVLKGTGKLKYESEYRGLRAGLIYFVPGNVPHAIFAQTELTLLAISNEHLPADSPKRLTLLSQ